MTVAPAIAELSELTEVQLPNGLVGFPDVHRFSLERWGGEESPYAILRAVDVEDLQFVVVPPSVFFPDYEPVIDDDLVEELELTTADDAVVAVIVTIAEPVDRSTANLLGPIIVNRHSRRAAQAVLSPDEHDPRTPLIPA